MYVKAYVAKRAAAKVAHLKSGSNLAFSVARDRSR